MNKQKSMVTVRVVRSNNVIRVRKASRLLRPMAPKIQAKLEKPRVFCDPRMPGGWHELKELVAGGCQAA
ncbi:MAG: hypothetical protein ACSHXK_06970 [Oceanococcus sp.]